MQITPTGDALSEGRPPPTAARADLPDRTLEGVDMADRDKLLALLAEFGLEPTVTAPATNDGSPRVTLTANTGNVDGYQGFYVDFDFDQDGKFKAAGIWE